MIATRRHHGALFHLLSHHLGGRGATAVRGMWRAVLLSLAFLFVGSAATFAGETGAPAIFGIRLHDSVGQVGAEFPHVQIGRYATRAGEELGRRLYTQQGYADGGFFQVLFAPDELGGGVWSVTQNTRAHVPGQKADALLADYVAEYGPYELLCSELFPGHAVYHVYWFEAPPDCSVPGVRPNKPYLYLNLVTGKWTEAFLVLADPALGEATRAFAMRE
ncbi:hypothetical protein N1030_14675 [Desulfovibrio mangrovi]|uniref:hypothetical protein n=1 Tax=Desulfovibrio mangrovi TaxID=2976983 RepID=UPI002245E25F|nr:hypothetical protein [Desulfovibrio mangrovi]UZP66841.1 hypothetical protein N1030_14675 [Desulfovibrio mangrovi]